MTTPSTPEVATSSAVLSSLAASMGDNPGSHLIAFLGNLPDDIIQQLIECQSAGSLNDHYRIMLLLAPSAVAVRESLYFSRQTGLDPEHCFRYYLPLLRYCDEIPHAEDYSQADEQVREHCTALILVTDALFEVERDFEANDAPYAPALDSVASNTEWVEVITDPRLRSLVFERPSDAKLIHDLIRSRKLLDFNQINALLSTMGETLNPVQEGVL